MLRHRTFFSLAELNEAIWEKLEVLNARPMQKLGVSRRELYERLDRPVLKPLPQESYELSTWKRCRVNIDYHVEVENNLYSVPYQLIHEKVEARVTASVVEVLFKGKRVASHPRKKGKGHYSTNPEQMPRSHREHLEWTPSRRYCQVDVERANLSRRADFLCSHRTAQVTSCQTMKARSRSSR